MKKNRIRICGRNTSTLPAPAITPSTSRLLSAPGGSDRCSASPSQVMPASTSAIGSAAQLNTAWKTKNSSAARTAGPATGCMTSASMRCSARRRGGSAYPAACRMRRTSRCVCWICSNVGSRHSTAGRAAGGGSASSRSSSARSPPSRIATVSTTGTPSSCSRRCRSSRKPRSRARSLMLSATSSGMPRSRSSSTSRRLSRRLVASTTQTTRSGGTSPASRPSRQSRVIASSSVVGVRL